MENNVQKQDAVSFRPLGDQQAKQERLERLFVHAVGTEDVSRREEFVKHYDLGTNRYQAVVFPSAVHYREPGQTDWKEIDNTLEEAVTAHGRHVLRNHAGRVKMEFPQEMDNGNMASITCDGKTFAWRFEEEVQPARAVARTGHQLRQDRLIEIAKKMPKFVGRTVSSLRNEDLAAAIETEQERRADIAALKAETAYENVLPGVSVRYELNGGSLKEDIILANRDALAHAAIRLPAEYDYEVSDANELCVLDRETGKQLFSMNTPIVYDAQNERTIAAVVLTACGAYTRMEYRIEEAYLNRAVFPVTIDPVVNSSNAIQNIQDTTIGEGRSYGYPNETYMMVGKYNGSVNTVAMLKFVQLARLTASDTVISAVLNITPKSSDSSKYIGAYEILKPWDVNTVGWTGFNPKDTTNISADAVDCIEGASSGKLSFDLTNLYRKWCTQSAGGVSNNNGVAFHTPYNISGANYSEIYSANASYESQLPVMYVSYVSHAGLESWWQYEQLSAGRAGTAYADLFNGNLVFEHSDTVMTGNRMPVSINHYYNSCLSDKNDYACGYGWKTSGHQKVIGRVHNSREYFVWVDGDGTEHFFERAGSQPYKDCEGMDLKLTYNNSDYNNRYIIIEDKGHNQMRFKVLQDQLAWLEWAKDACGNTVNYSYVSGEELGGRIDTITDPVGRVTKYEYSGDLLSSIRIPDAEAESYRYVYFTYDANSRLTGVRYSDLGGTAVHTEYAYDGDTNMLTMAHNHDGVQVNIGYEASSLYHPSTIVGGVTAQMRRVLSMECLATDAFGTPIKRGVKQLFNYKHMCTEVTAVEAETTDAGKKLYYQFNDAGNVVCVRDDLGYASFTKFESNIENKPSEQTPVRKAVINLLRNPDFSANWVADMNVGNGTITKDTTVTCMSAPSIKFTPVSACMEYRQEVTLKANTTYVFSAYVKTQDCILEEAAYISIQKKDNFFDSASSKSVYGTTETAIGNELPTDGWERIHAVYHHTASVDEAYYVKFMHGASGTAWFSCPQLEEGSIVNPVNLVSNGDFRYTYASGDQTLANDWTVGPNNLATANSSVFSASTDSTFPEALSGNYIQVEGRPDQNGVGYIQQFDLRGSAGDVFVVGGWADAKSVPNATTANKGFGIAMRLKKKSDGQWINYYMLPYNEEWVGWQFGSWALVAGYDYTAIDMTLVYTHNCGNAKFSNLFMYREQFGQSYDYDENHNVVSTGTLSGQKSHIEYDDADNVQRYTQPGRDHTNEDNQYWFYYGNSTANRKKHLVQRSRTPMHVTDYFTYDSYGNALSTSRVDYRVYTESTAESAYPFIRTESTYDANGNYIATTKDARGNEVTQVIDPNTGTLTSVTDPDGQTVNYTYDASKRVTAVQTTADGKTYRNGYTYENDRIKTVSHNTTSDAENDVTYTFEYDSLGRKTNVKVGTQTLSTNVYENDRAGLLSEVQYGNGGKVKYTYDDFDRLTGVRYDAETVDRYTYKYGANGRAAEVQDANLGITSRTEYDLSERPCRTEKIDSDGERIQQTSLKYDKLGNLAHFTEELSEEEIHRSSYTYDRDNRITEIAYDPKDNAAGTAEVNKVAYTYDALGRVATRAITSGENTQTATYEYVNGGHGTNSTTPLVESIQQPGVSFDYTYDNRGNIISEKRYAQGAAEADKLETTYAYDALGQLIRVNDPHENATWVYTYDRGGNILNKTRYAFTTGNLGTAIETVPYTYGDANWKDKLTAYNGIPITYDAIGNPLNDGERVYTWGAGRQLKHVSMAVTGSASGLRISNGSNAESQTMLQIIASNENSVLTAHVIRNGREITDECADSAFTWTCTGGSSTRFPLHAKQISLTSAETAAGVQIACAYSETMGSYGTVQVDNNLTASHTPSTADANDTFVIENGKLKVTTASANGTDYTLNNGRLTVNNGFTGTITSTAAFTEGAQTREIDFIYDHNGLRTGKVVTEGEKTETTEYMLHGKLITHMTKRCVDENGEETVQNLHFFYDAQSKPAFVEYNGTKYRYLQNLQGDIVGIVDTNGNLVVEYKYDAWGKPISTTGSMADTLGKYNPFRYRGYVYDEETELYYLRNRYYSTTLGRFINTDKLVGELSALLTSNIFVYCKNNPYCRVDSEGMKSDNAIWEMPIIIDIPIMKVVQDIPRKVADAALNQILTNTKIAREEKARIFEMYSSGWERLVNSMIWFKDKVYHLADWDYKNNIPGWLEESNVSHVMVDGIEMTMEDYGNFHYGFVGYAMGFPREVLIMGSYYAHHTSHNNWDEDPHDLEMVNAGIDMAARYISQGLI